jgi:hypothetical protein
MSYFHDATVTHQGRTFHFSAEAGRAVESPGQYWVGPGHPSTWLAVAVFEEVRRELGGAPEAVALEVAAKAMGMPVDRLVSSITWQEQYMRWHDGDPEYRILSG